MKHFVLLVAAAAMFFGQDAFAQKRVKNLYAENNSLEVMQVANNEQPVQLSRYLFAGYNTLCLPMSVSAEQLEKANPGMRVERFEGIRQEGSTLGLYFVDCTGEGIKAGIPYLVFSPESKFLRVKSTDADAVSTDIQTVRMSDGRGNQVSFSSSWNSRQKDGLYGIPAKQDVKVLESILVRTTAELTFKPTRCGFDWESQSANATRMEIKHVSSFTNVTSVKLQKAVGSLVDVYDLKGNLIKKQVDSDNVKTALPAGIYIIDGEKVTIK